MTRDTREDIQQWYDRCYEMLGEVSMSKLAIAMATTVALTSSASAWSDIWRPTPWGWAHRQKTRCSEHKTKLLSP
jgi:hypothetical protein